MDIRLAARHPWHLERFTPAGDRRRARRNHGEHDHSFMDFRDQVVEDALRKAVGRYRPENKLRSRLVRIAIVAALALATCVGFWSILHYSSTKPGRPAPEKKPISVELLPAPARR